MALLFRIVGHAVFNVLLRRGMKIGWIRWTLAILFTLFAAVCALAAFTVNNDQSQQLALGIGAFFFALLAAVSWFTIIRYQRAINGLKERSRANVKQLIAEGKLVTLPAASTAAPKAVTPDDIASVERYMQRVRDIFEKNKSTVSEYDAPALFRQAMQEVAGITGHYDRLLSGPAMTFASLPKPWRDVGAAEVMYRLSFLRGNLYVPAGLRQGLVYAFHAQFVAPLQPDALLVQLRIYSGYNTPLWREKAAKTMDILNRYAASHPGLPATEMVYRRRIGEFDRALECADLALNGFLSPTQSATILDSKASILQALKRNDEAVAAFQQALSYFPNPWTWHNLSILFDTMGRYPEALDANSHALAMMNFGVAQKMRATILGHMGQSQV
ncbi:MAG TPA: tetratricopeptide repeat protein [Ktedonobacterales bacterium]